MKKLIDIPDAVADKIKKKAAAMGLNPTAYIRFVLSNDAYIEQAAKVLRSGKTETKEAIKISNFLAESEDAYDGEKHDPYHADELGFTDSPLEFKPPRKCVETKKESFNLKEAVKKNDEKLKTKKKQP